ncbi:MAG TPA: glycoside hydrolase family 43 protein [Acidimicrobiia bacterium]|nr:glycoside hydrolase family 43 protein [Acidimicrobiia bacterium]
MTVMDATHTDSTPVITPKIYRNPLSYSDGIERTDPDPFALKHRGRYYCYSTGVDGVNVSVSDDLVEWEHEGFALQTHGQKNYWAPCVIHHEGTFYMYVSSAPGDSDDPHDERLQLAVSNDPLGPFEVTTTLFDTFSIDADVVRDSDGQFYLFYSTNDVTGLEHGNPGTAIVVDRLLGFDRLAGNPRPVVVPTLREEIFEENRFGDGRDWYTIEGATYFTKRDRAYLTYSGNAYVQQDYFVGYARAHRTEAIGDHVWQKYPNDDDYRPLIRRRGSAEGTGHNSIVRGPDLVETWIMYHGRDATRPLVPGQEQRTRRIDQLWTDGNMLRTDAPSDDSRSAPTLPDLSDQFDGESLDSHWRVLEGHFNPGERATVSSAAGLTVAVTTRSFASYRAELDVSALPSHLGARFGVRPIHFGPDDYVEVLLDAASRRITATRVSGNIAAEMAAGPLSEAAISVYRHLRIDRQFDRVTVTLDGVVVLQFSAPEGAASFGLTAIRTEASFSGFAINGHLDLYGQDMSDLARFYKSDETVSVDSDGLTARHGREVALVSQNLPVRWRYAHEFELLSPTNGHVRFCPAYGDTDNYVLIEALGSRIRVEIVERGQAREVAAGPLDEPNFTVLSRPRGNDLEIRVAGHHLLIPDAANYPSQRIGLTAARLRGLEASSCADQT